VCDESCNVPQCTNDLGDCDDVDTWNGNGNGDTGKLEDLNRCPNGTSYTLPPAQQCLRCACDPETGRVRCTTGERLRKEVHDLPKEQFAKFAGAVQRLKDKGEWERYVDIHSFPGWHAAHGPRSHFLHWHRRFLYVMETALIMETQDCSIAIPYWVCMLYSRN